MKNNTKLSKSFKKLLLLETKARDIYSAILGGFSEDTGAREKIYHIRDEEIGHMRLAEILVKMAESADSRKKKTARTKKDLDFIKKDFAFKGHLLKAIEENLNAKIQDFSLLEKQQESKRKIVHDLRNPLTLTKWISEWLLEEKKEKLTDSQKEMIERIKNANQSMLSFLSELA